MSRGGEWLSLYNELQQVVEESYRLIDERKELEAKHLNAIKPKTKLRKNLMTLQKRYSKLEELLQQDEEQIGAGEAARRFDLMKRLQGDIEKLGGKPRQGVPAKRGIARENDQTRDHNDQQLYQQHQQRLEKQDEALDHIYEGLGRIRQQGENIGDELDYQDRLLDDVDEKMDDVDQRLQGNNNAIKSLMKRDSGNFGFCIIILLLVAIVAYGHCTIFLSNTTAQIVIRIKEKAHILYHWLHCL